MSRLTKRVVETANPKDRQFTLWCSELRGFSVFIQPSGVRSYFIDYRTKTGQRRRMTIGRHGTITAEQARKIALTKLADVVKGNDPALEKQKLRQAMTVKELCSRYWDAAEKGLILGKGNRPKKQTTLYTDRGRITRQILPLLGRKVVRDLTKVDINHFVRDVMIGKTAVVKKTKKKRGKSIVKGGAGTAARTVGLLGGILSFAVSEGIIEANPVAGIRKPAGKKKTRRLDRNEYAQLGEALGSARREGEIEQGVDAMWLLAITGCRRGEIINLKWSEIDFEGQCLRLDDSKEGASIRPLGKTVTTYLDRLRHYDYEPYVLPPARRGHMFGGLPGVWKRTVHRTELADVTPHTLRHSYASVAADLGFTEPTIASLLGHSSSSITSRYIHQLDEVLIAAADSVAAEVEAMMLL